MTQGLVVMEAASCGLPTVFLAGCGDVVDVQGPACGSIPENGCPESNADACADPLCAKVYSCVDEGIWALRRTCGAFDAAAIAQPSRDAGATPQVDAGGKGDDTSCSALQTPDCSLSTANTCTSGCCDCEDVFACENHEWNLVASCIDGTLSTQK